MSSRARAASCGTPAPRASRASRRVTAQLSLVLLLLPLVLALQLHLGLCRGLVRPVRITAVDRLPCFHAPVNGLLGANAAVMLPLPCTALQTEKCIKAVQRGGDEARFKEMRVDRHQAS